MQKVNFIFSLKVGDIWESVNSFSTILATKDMTLNTYSAQSHIPVNAIELV